MRALRPLIQNLWVPKNIKKVLKPLFIAKIVEFDHFDEHQDFILFTTYDKPIKFKSKLYRLYYELDPNHKIEVKDFSDLQVKMKAILNCFYNYYFNNFGESPDFEGH
jgi:hypothetical protein